jgi:hypothetical protein
MIIMVKVQNIKTGEIHEFKSVKEWETFILQVTGKEKINKGHLYNVINGKSKSCYGFKLAEGETPIPQTPKKEMVKWQEMVISNDTSVKEFVGAFLQDEFGFKIPDIEYGVKSKRGAWGFFQWNVRTVSAVGLYVGDDAIKAGQDQAKGTLIHEALHLMLFTEKKGYSDGQRDFENLLLKMKNKYPEFKISSNHGFEIVTPGGYKTEVNGIRKKYGFERI